MATAIEHVQNMDEDKPVVCLRAGTTIVDVKPVFSYDLKCVFCCAGHNIKVIGVESGECIRELKNGHRDRLTGIAINPGCKLQLISTGRDGQIIFWDYSDGVIVRKYNVHQPLWGLIHVQNKKSQVIVSVIQEVYHNTDNKPGYALVKHTLERTDTKIETQTLLKSCENDPRKAAVGCEAKYYAAIKDRNLYVASEKGRVQSHILKKDFADRAEKARFTCLACHPTEMCIITGCRSGKIILWFNFLDVKNVVKSSYHWHSLPVLDVCFTAEGSYFLSGGYECVLVKWQYNSHFKEFLPRLGSPINHVTCSQDNTLYATSHDNNGIHLITSNFNVVNVIQGLTRGHFVEKTENPIPVGLIQDPRSHALVTNGIPGHLQFYLLHTDTQLYNLDIVCQNYISPENLKQPTVVTEVLSAAFDSRGQWLATFEYWDDHIMSPDLLLKFWEFSEKSQTFTLNTLVDVPHSKKINALKFRPGDPDLPPMVVSSADDNQFKLWLLVDESDIYKSQNKWTCESLGFYRDLPAGSIDFSEDGSLLAVAFTTTITLWDPETNILKSSLVNTVCKDSVRHLLFGRLSCCHLLVSTTSTHLTVWNLLTCTVQWSVAMEISVLTSDPLTSYMAAVSAERDLFVFEASNPEPVYSHSEISSSDVLAGIFIPHIQESSYSGDLAWQRHSQFYFFNKNQELLMIDSKDNLTDSSEIKLKMQQSVPSTPLSLLLAKQQKKNKQGRLESVPQNKKLLDEMLATPAHVQPSLSSLCQTFLSSLLLRNKNTEANPENEDDDDDDDEVSERKTVDSDSDMEVDIPKMEKMKTDNVETKQSKENVVDSSKSEEERKKEEKVLKFLETKCDWLSDILP